MSARGWGEMGLVGLGGGRGSFEFFLCYETQSLSIGIWTDGLLGEIFCFCSPLAKLPGFAP